MAPKVFNNRWGLRPAKGPALGGCSEATSSNLEMGWTTTHTSRACFKCNQMGHWAKNCPSPCPLPGPCPQCGQNGHWKDDCPSFSLRGRSDSHFHSQQSEGLTDLLGLVAEDGCGPGTLASFKITLEEPRVTVQVAGRPQSPTWCYLTSRVSFILHRSPWWGWTVSSTSQKEKTALFKFKILIKVNFKIQVTK
jgi:hypothetical protein